jgi:uncharacterized protein (TIGR00255 family)
MLTSMTGFGKGTGSIEDIDVSIELRSVNSRYLEISVLTPKFLNFLEETCRKYIRGHVPRGNVQCYVNVGNGGGSMANYTVNMPLLKNFMATVEKISEETGIAPAVNMQDLLNQPELLGLEESRIDPEVLTEKILHILQEALTGLLDMERKEGEYIRGIFAERLTAVEGHLDSIETMQKPNVAEHIKLMQERVRVLLEDEPGASPLHQEIVQMADKLDISEETERFRSHIVQFRTYLDLREPVGKRLNFLLQEMNREVTTMGNKASNSGISQHVVEIKNEIETIREQVQNIQ